MPPIEYISERGPAQHGETLRDYRLSPRIVQLVYRRNADGRAEWWRNRADMLNLLRPNRQLSGKFEKGILTKTLSRGRKRWLDVLVQQGPVFGPRSMEAWDEWAIQEEIRFVAGDPTFYDPEEKELLWSVQNLGGLWFWHSIYPDDLFFDISFGTDVVTGQKDLHYDGTWLSYPVIIFTGPLNHPVVENLTTGKSIEMTYNIPAGETVTLDLAFGNKKVSNSLGRNLVGTIVSTSDLAEFCIAPEPQAVWCGAHARPCGLNLIKVGGSGGVVGQTEIRLTYRTRYLGI